MKDKYIKQISDPKTVLHPSVNKKKHTTFLVINSIHQLYV